MKKWLLFAAACAAAGLLTRLPHPARDISGLEPVQLVYLYEDEGLLRMETDTGARGSGEDLRAAAEDLRARADGVIFLETAEFLLLDPDVPFTEDLCALLRPGCRVFCTQETPDLPAAVQYLSVHPPKTALRDLRADAALQKGGQP